eukprot:5281588-Lingulodinium_polyedra.AAC.1
MASPPPRRSHLHPVDTILPMKIGFDGQTPVQMLDVAPRLLERHPVARVADVAQRHQRLRD